MWPRRFFAARMFAPRFFPQSTGGVAPPPVGGTQTTRINLDLGLGLGSR